jgi:hypothetical protein
MVLGREGGNYYTCTRLNQYTEFLMAYVRRRTYRRLFTRERTSVFPEDR